MATKKTTFSWLVTSSVIPTHLLGMALIMSLSMITTSARAQTLPNDACIAKCKAEMAASVGSDEEAVKAATEECAKGCIGRVAVTPPPAPVVEEFDVTSCSTPKKGKSIDIEASEEKGKCLLKDFEPSDCIPKKGKSVDLDASEERGKCTFKVFETSDCTQKKGKQLDEDKSESKGRCIYAVAPPAEDKPAEKAESTGTMPWWAWIVIGILVLAFAGMTASRQREAKCADQYRLSKEEGRVEAQRRRDADARRQREDEVRRRQEAAEEQRRERQAEDTRWQRERDAAEAERRHVARRPAADLADPRGADGIVPLPPRGAPDDDPVI